MLSNCPMKTFHRKEDWENAHLMLIMVVTGVKSE